MPAVRAALPLWLVLFAAYAATIAIDASPAHRFGTPEVRRLLVAESIVSDRDLDVADEYRDQAWRAWHAGPLRPVATPADGRQLEPVGVGFAVLIAPAYRIAGPSGVQLELAALAALAFCLAAALGRALVPEPWATRAALVCGLSPPALGAATAISPEAAGAAALAATALLALRVRAAPQPATAFWTAALAAALPWLAAALIAPAFVVAGAVARWLRRGTTAFVALEVALTSAVVYITVNDRLFGGLTPGAVARGGATGAHDAGDVLARWPRVARVWLDPHHGLFVWLPFALLAVLAIGLLWRSRHERLAVAVDDQGDVEAAAGFFALIVLAVVVTAIVLAPSLDGSGRAWWHARHLVPALPFVAALAAWGLRFAPRVGAVLAAATFIESVVLVATR